MKITDAIAFVRRLEAIGYTGVSLTVQRSAFADGAFVLEGAGELAGVEVSSEACPFTESDVADDDARIVSRAFEDILAGMVGEADDIRRGPEASGG